MVSCRGRTLLQVILVGLVIVSLGQMAPASASKTKWYGWGPVGAYRGPVTVTCHTNAQGLVYAVASTHMWVRNTGSFSHWVQHFKLKARVVSTSPGISPQSNWYSVRKDATEFQQDKKYNRVMAVSTIQDPKNAAGDWKVQIKLIWERKAPFPDIVRKTEYPLDGCPGTGGPAVA